MSIIIYGKSNCPSCDTAKQLLTAKAIEFEYKQLDVDYTVEELLDLYANHGVNPRSGLPLVVALDQVLSLDDLKAL